MRDNGALAIRILLSAELRVGGRKHWMREHLGVATRVAGQGSVARIDALAVPADKVIRHAELRRRPPVGAIKAQRPFQPRDPLRSLTRPYQNAAAVGIGTGIARIDFERAV